MVEADREPRAGQSGTPFTDTASLAVGALDDLFEAGRAAGHLLRAELRLARSSLAAILWLMLATLVLAFGAWLGLNALAFAVVHAWSGNVLLGTGVVFLVNLGGVLWCIAIMRRCVRDLALPRTRRLFDRRSTSASPTSKAHA